MGEGRKIIIEGKWVSRVEGEREKRRRKRLEREREGKRE